MTMTGIAALIRPSLGRARILARGVKRAVTPPPSIRALPPDQTAGTLAFVAPPAALEAGSTPTWTFRIENKSAVAWPAAGPFAVRFECSWRAYDGTPFGETVTLPVAGPIYPGEPVELRANVPAPPVVGDFVFTAVLTQGDGPLPGAGPCVPVSEVAVPVVGPRSTDIDYHAVFRDANLAENHWWVVGAYHSKEQYERSQKERLGMLVEHGLTPDSHLLDVGCGTGQMASACEPYLSDRGGYAGADIGAEAIQFCKRTFKKPNFRFAQGGMTTIPFAPADGRFDMAIYFSVFTHTYPDETALLLAQTANLLKPTGAVICDVITSPLVERGAGHRGEMTLNREHFLRLAAAVGFGPPTIVGRWPWNAHAERIMVKFALR
jgi:SAM-dependent methyltransferase